MEELRLLVTRAQADDLDAYAEIVRRFQDMAYGYAYSVLGDFHLAEDAAQEAFVQAYRDLSMLREAAAFAGWFRRIVFKHCDRITRRRRPKTAAPDALAETVSHDRSPAEAAERSEMSDAVLAAIQALPDTERTVTTLYYINGYSHKDIAEFLEVPETTVNGRLRTSRRRLKERMMSMVADEIKSHPLADEFPERIRQLLAQPRPLEIEGHPIRELWAEIQSAFPGWQIVDGPEVESLSFRCRLMNATPHQAVEHGVIAFGDRALRSDTTATALRAMSGRTLPSKLLCAGRVADGAGRPAQALAAAVRARLRATAGADAASPPRPGGL